MGLYHYHRRNWLIALTLSIGLITLIARVLGGIHYPGDIIGGLIFGILGAYLLRPIVDRITTLILPLCIKIASWVRL